MGTNEGRSLCGFGACIEYSCNPVSFGQKRCVNYSERKAGPKSVEVHKNVVRMVWLEKVLSKCFASFVIVYYILSLFSDDSSTDSDITL